MQKGQLDIGRQRACYATISKERLEKFQLRARMIVIKFHSPLQAYMKNLYKGFCNDLFLRGERKCRGLNYRMKLGLMQERFYGDQAIRICVCCD